MLCRIGLSSLVLMVLQACQVSACGPFLRVPLKPTLRQELAKAELVAYGTLANPKMAADGINGTVNLNIKRVYKNHPIIHGRSVLQINRYIPVNDPEKPPRFVVFFDIVNGELHAFKGVPVKSESLLRYLGPIARNPRRRNMLYSFRHLDHPGKEVAEDALMEFVQADYREVFPLARDLPAEKLARWLKSPKLAAARVRLYATLLGDCGSEKHADLLRQLLDKVSEKQSTGSTSINADGLLVGYTLLKPKEGLALLLDIFEDPNAGLAIRFDAVLAIRFLHDFRPDRVPRTRLLERLCLLLAREDIADIAVEDLRDRHYAPAVERVLAIYSNGSNPLIRRAVIRFALGFPKDPRAVKFMVRLRREQPQLVKEIEKSIRQHTLVEFKNAKSR